MTWRQAAYIFAACIAVALSIALLQGCKTVDCIPEVVYRDSIRTEYKHDSIYRYERDSIFIKQTTDTVWVERYTIRYKDVLKVQRDTVVLTQEVEKVREVEVPVEVPRKRSGWDKWCSRWFICCLVVIVLLILWKIADYIPFLSKYKTILTTLIRLKK